MIKKIFSSATVLAVSLALSSIFQIALLISLSYFYGVSIVGQYALALSITAPLFVLIYQSYRNYIISNIDDLIFSIEDLTKYRILISIFFFFFVCILSFLSDNFLIIFVFFFKFMEGLSELIISFLAKDKKIIDGAKIYFMRVGLCSIFFLGGIYLDLDIYKLFLLLGSAYLIAYILYDIHVFKIRIREVISFSQKDIVNMVYLWGKVKFLVLSSILGALLFNISRYALGIKDNSLLGEFTIISSVSLGINVIAIALGQTIQPWLVLSEKNKFYKILLLSLVIFLIVLCTIFLFIFFFYDFFIKLTNLNISMYNFFLINFLFVPLYFGQVLSFCNMALKQYKVTFYVNCIGLVVSLILVYPLIEFYGSIGVGINFFIIGLIQIVGYSWAIFLHFWRCNE